MLEILLAAALVPVFTHVLDYRVLKSLHLKSRRWGLNVSCGGTDGVGVNADVVRRDVPNFVLIKDACRLPFRDAQFESAICSHTMEHVENPETFYRELRRVSKNVTILVPPLWDVAAILHFWEHKWQFVTFTTKHVNKLPPKIRLPYWFLQERFVCRG